jgi:hypothetical protein
MQKIIVVFTDHVYPTSLGIKVETTNNGETVEVVVEVQR